MDRRTISALLLALLVSCSAAGAETMQTFEFTYPDTQPAPVVFDLNAGVLNLQPVEGSSVTGRVTTNVRQWQVSQTIDADGAQRVSQGETRNEVIPNATNEWQVQMGSGTPLAFTINGMAASGNLDLSGLPLQTLSINATSGSYNLSYDSPSPLDGGLLRIQLGSGNVTIEGLFHSRIREVNSLTSSGSQIFEFGGGELARNLEGSIETKTGDVVLRIPIGTPVRVMFTAASGRVMETSPDFVEVSKNVYETAEYADSDQPRLQLAVRSVAGDLRLYAVPPL
ncbi:MAG: toast rack family protein [Anaerolineae bacterium]|nr:toast rack family protein [Anaerolineae bacterium]